MIAVLFGIVGIAFICQAVQHGGWWWLLLWPGISFVTVAAGYFGLGARVFGKTADGTQRWWPVALLAPYLLFSRVVWEILTRVSREDCCNEVVPGLWLGRRPRPSEIPPEVGLLVDMTCEFPVPVCRSAGVQRLCLPTLDAMVPDDDSFRRAINTIVACPAPVYVFCAQGHGRSATLAAAVLIARADAPNVETAETMLRRLRPGVRLSRSQRAFVRRMTAASG